MIYAAWTAAALGWVVIALQWRYIRYLAPLVMENYRDGVREGRAMTFEGDGWWRDGHTLVHFDDDESFPGRGHRVVPVAAYSVTTAEISTP